MWSETASEIKMAIVKKNILLNKTIFMMTGRPIRYVMGVLLSNAADFYARYSFPRLDNKGMTLTKEIMLTFPIPKIPEKEQQPFIELVDQILNAKQADTDTTDLERQIDSMVYQLYGLTDDEIGVVEQGGGR